MYDGLMKKLLFFFCILHVFISSIGILLLFSLNQNSYSRYLESNKQTKINILQVQNVYDFLENKSDLNPNFEKLEALHLQDVKNIFTILEYILLLSTLIFISIVVFWVYTGTYHLIFRWLILWSIGTIILVVIVLSFIFLDFVQSFQVFHKIFFPEWNRMFPEESLLIQLFPESFFRMIIQIILLRIFIVSVLTITILSLIKKILQKAGKIKYYKEL
jgi:hypothetical protein